MRAWRDGNDAIIHLEWWECDDAETASAFARRLAAENTGEQKIASALGANRDSGSAIRGREQTIVAHGWAQDAVAVMAAVECAALNEAECSANAANVARHVSGLLPGEVYTVDILRTMLWPGLLLGVVVMGGARLLARLGARMRRFEPYETESDDPRWHDVTPAATKLRLHTRSAYRARSIRSLALIALGVGALGIFDIIHIGRWWSALVMVLALWQFRRQGRRLSIFSTREQAAWWLGRYRIGPRKLSWAVLAGVAFAVGAAFIVLATISAWVLGAWVYAGGGVQSVHLHRIVVFATDLGVPSLLRAPFLMLVGFFSIKPFNAGTLLIVGITAAHLLRILSRRAMARHLREMLALDSRPPLLLLRNFADDTIKIEGSRLTRPSFLASTLGAMSYIRRVRFEELAVRQLTEIGPVVAVGNPRDRMRPIGAARGFFTNDQWQSQVETLAGTARAVVFLAAPKQINEGLKWELDLVAQRLRHQRIVLIIPSIIPKSLLLRRWEQFRIEISSREVFAGATEAWIPSGAHVLVHEGAGSWRVWGTKYRTEWSYAVAIHALAEYFAAQEETATPVL